MPAEEHYRKLENMFHGAPINRIYEPRLRIEAGRARLVMPVKAEHFHAAGSLHGSVYFKALDDATYFAVNSLVEDVFMLTTQFNIHLLRPVVEGELRVEAEVTHRGRNLMLAEGIAYDGKGRMVARGSGSFMRSRTALDETIGYRLQG